MFTSSGKWSRIQVRSPKRYTSSKQTLRSTYTGFRFLASFSLPYSPVLQKQQSVSILSQTWIQQYLKVKIKASMSITSRRIQLFPYIPSLGRHLSLQVLPHISWFVALSVEKSAPYTSHANMNCQKEHLGPWNTNRQQTYPIFNPFQAAFSVYSSCKQSTKWFARRMLSVGILSRFFFPSII